MLGRIAPTLYGCLHAKRRGLEGHKSKMAKYQSCVEVNWQLVSVLFFVCELMCVLICWLLNRFLGGLLSVTVPLLWHQKFCLKVLVIDSVLYAGMTVKIWKWETQGTPSTITADFSGAYIQCCKTEITLFGMYIMISQCLSMFLMTDLFSCRLIP